MKRFWAIIAVLLLLPLFSVSAEEEGNKAVLGGVLNYGGEDESTETLVHEAFIPDDAEKKPIGTDDRVSVNEREYPYRAIAYIEAHAPCGCNWTGTGFLVGPSGLMTAGHVLYCEEHDCSVDQLTLYFGYKSSKNYLYKYTKGTTYWYNDSGKSSSEEYDYGYIKLKERVGDKMGWFGVSARSDENTDVKVCYAAGYRNGVLKTDYDWVYVNTPYQIKHTIDTEPGYSGCPIFDGDYYAIAINVAHSITLEYNYGCRITSWLVKTMRSDGIFD